MIKTSFWGLGKPDIEHAVLPSKLPEADLVPADGRVTLYHPRTRDFRTPSTLQVGDPVKAGQRLSLYPDENTYVVSPIGGKVAELFPQEGNFGVTYTGIAIDADGSAEVDEAFSDEYQTRSIEVAARHLGWLPGNPPLAVLADPEKEIHTIVVCGTDDDLLVATNQYVLRNDLDAVTEGIKVLKQLSGVEKVILTTAGETIQGYGHIGATIMRVDTAYPAALPHMIMHQVLGITVPAGKSPEDLGVCFVSAEATVALGRAFQTGRVPCEKTLTLITKSGLQRIVRVPIGVAVGELLARYDISVQERDRLVFGGPMRGLAIYSLQQPIMPDTDAVMVLDRADAAEVTDYPCINCGECVRNCPTRIPVNLLVRFLEAGQYDEAADEYDLYSCVDCGLCSFVCVSKIPIYQYIRLAKYEIERAKAAEAANA
jgi:electron transport complex protein RnfC